MKFGLIQDENDEEPEDDGSDIEGGRDDSERGHARYGSSAWIHQCKRTCFEQMWTCLTSQSPYAYDNLQMLPLLPISPLAYHEDTDKTFKWRAST